MTHCFALWQDKQQQVLRLDAERLELGRKLAEMEGLKRCVPSPPSAGSNARVCLRCGTVAMCV